MFEETDLKTNLAASACLTMWVRGQATKSAVGRLRPDFLDRCQPAGGANYQFKPQYGTDTGVVCTQTDIKLLDDGRSSFPSGAASPSFRVGSIDTSPLFISLRSMSRMLHVLFVTAKFRE